MLILKLEKPNEAETCINKSEGEVKSSKNTVELNEKQEKTMSKVDDAGDISQQVIHMKFLYSKGLI